MICRIVRDSVEDPRMNEALEEAMLLARHEGQPLDTFRVWKNRKAVVLAGNELIRLIDQGICSANEIPIVRRESSGTTMYQDEGVLNMTCTVNQKAFFPDTGDLRQIHTRLWEPVVDGISRWAAHAKPPRYGDDLTIDGEKLCQGWIRFYHDLVLFQLSVNVDADLGVMNAVLRGQRNFTTLARRVSKTVEVDNVEKCLIDAVARRFEVEFLEQDFSPLEKSLAHRLYEIKYSREEWNLERKAPLSLKDALVEVYVAYPPTESCRQIVDNIRTAVADLTDAVEVRIWMRGKGLEGKGHPPGVEMSPALIEASKKSIIPAVIINGQMAFSRNVPTGKEVRDKILQTLGRQV